MGSFSLKTCSVFQDASVEAIKKTLLTWGDADAQATRLADIVKKGWYFIDSEGRKITTLIAENGKPVSQKDGSPHTPETLPISFLNASSGMRFDNHVPQVVPASFNETSGSTADVDGIDEETAISLVDDCFKQFGVKRTIEALNNGLRLHPTSKEKEIGKAKPKRESDEQLRTAFMLANGSNVEQLLAYAAATKAGNLADFLTKWKASVLV